MSRSVWVKIVLGTILMACMPSFSESPIDYLNRHAAEILKEQEARTKQDRMTNLKKLRFRSCTSLRTPANPRRERQ